ncbi:TPM domain-containing protein [[Mycobacterium] nativiensis]|uniref:TPM domain-containing protein n=1 Tax=[Mycobacterium] nativiensis TaxID=2855503 RepID=A0ABU5Y3Y1_9MYCO|nr:TPM domain-containing protein [Mycolicibacter sp. MYC340]MEB3034905.1 TPM domain-containing protein [Mycolicibacter sp. MYC340]
MRITRLTGAALAVIAAVLLLVAPSVAAQPPMRLPSSITDSAGVLSPSDRDGVQASIDKLYAERHIRLWVVYVDVFSGQTADDWGRTTARLSDLGNNDAVLAVATADRSYAFLVSNSITEISTGKVDSLRRNQIEPALHRGDWAGAATTAAAGLNAAAAPTEVSWAPILIALAAIALAGVVVFLVARYLRRRRRNSALVAARRLDSTDPNTLADVPVYTLDALSREKVVAVDNAIRTSANELELAVEEFGEDRTRSFAQAVAAAKATMEHAFTVRQQLDDDIPETPAQQRDLLTGVIVTASKADRELETQRTSFEQLRDLVLNAPARLDAMTQQLVELTGRIPAAERHLVELHTEFDATALTSVSGNVKTAQDRAAFAERNITRARGLADHPVTGGQSDLVDAVRAAESALRQGRALLDAVDTAARDIRHAVATLPDAITDIEAGIGQANTQLQRGAGTHKAELTSARDTAVKAVSDARSSGDPLGAFTTLIKADSALDQLLDTLAEERAAAERLARTLEQALFTASSRIRAVSDYIDTRRGSVGPEARTRLAEARRRLDAAQDLRTTDVAGAITQANGAATLAAAAQSLAKADVQSAQRAYYGRYGGGPGGGNDTGAMLGGIIIGNILSGGGFGGGSGGGGGWSPTSFGGSSGGGGFFGGGGRF